MSLPASAPILGRILIFGSEMWGAGIDMLGVGQLVVGGGLAQRVVPGLVNMISEMKSRHKLVV